MHLLDSLLALARAGAVGLIVKGRVAREARGFALDPVGGWFQSDRAAETWDPDQIVASAAPGGELTYTVVPHGTEVRAGIDRDELDAGSDPADPGSVPGPAPASAPAVPTGLRALPLGRDRIHLTWRDRSDDERTFHVERAAAGGARYETVALLPADATAWVDRGLAPGRYDYGVAAVNAAGRRGGH